jgi:hypothetical protein
MLTMRFVRCIAAATGRLYEAFTFDYDHDVTWQSPSPFLWAVAECTCVLVVFCVPAIPKVFVDSRILSSLMTLTRSLWSTLHQKKQTTTSSSKLGRSWIASSVSKASPHVTRGAQESALEGGDSQIHLADLEAGRRPSNISDEDTSLAPSRQATMSILRTTEVATEVHQSDRASCQKMSDERCSWAEGRVKEEQ